MHVTVNNERVELSEGATVGELLESLGRARELCAVEVNETLAPKRERDGVVLKDADRVEIVTLVGGG